MDFVPVMDDLNNVACRFDFLLLFVFVSLTLADKCTIEGEVRLAGTNNNLTTEGRVEICLDEVWGTVCDDGWDTLAAKVVCRQLNLTMDYAVTTSVFGGGSGPIHYINAFCSGNENHLLNCIVSDAIHCSHEDDVGVRCPTEPELVCEEGDIQLVNDTDGHGRKLKLTGSGSSSLEEGRVEICVNNVWGTICKNGWDALDAKVVCRQLNLSTDYTRALTKYEGGSGPIHHTYISCTGSETHLVNCSNYNYRTSCLNDRYAGASCPSEPECKPTDIRLVSAHVGGIDPANRGDGSTTEGRVEICLNGVWGSVCDNGWDSLDAQVVCRQLNLMTHYARALYHYGGGSDSIHQAEIECTGRETHLTNCSTGHSSYCSHSTDVGVICPSKPECNTTDIRLVSNQVELGNNNSTTEGRVEICLNGVWGTVCDRGWDRADAEVVCQQLNLSTRYARALNQYGGGSGAIHYAEVSCIGIETQLADCTASYTGDRAGAICSHYKDAGVMCPSEPECKATDIQLVDRVESERLAGSDDSSVTEGRVEICINGEWWTVCNNGWDSLDAKVVCQQLNLTTDYAHALNQYIGGSGLIYFDEFQCTGRETLLVNCSTGFKKACSHYNDVGVSCPSENECNETHIRLVGGDSITEGRVEICLNGVWGTVCDRGWDRLEAKVVCRQLNLPTDYARALSQYGGGSGPIHYASMYCAGSEAQLADCLASYTGDSASRLCKHFQDAGVSCPAPECEEADIRLVSRLEGETRPADSGNHSNSTQEGRVEICFNGVWGTVCDEGWDTLDAKVVCQQLNQTTDYARALNQYGGGSGPIHFAGVSCTGSETELADCTVDKTGDTDRPNVCGSHYDDAGVRCPSEPECDETDIRLRDGRTPADGRVEVCLNGHWGSFCVDTWDDIDAKVVCRQLGYYDGTLYVLPNSGSNNSLHFNLNDVQCTGNENKLSECEHRGIGIHDCHEGRDEARVVCTGPRTFSGSKPEVTTTIPPFNHSTESPTVSRSSSSSSEAMAGILVGIVGVMLATVVPVVVLLVFVYKKRHRRKQLERVQMDILAIPGHGQPTGSHVETHIYEAATGNSRESELQRQLTSLSDPNPYSVNDILGSSSYTHETRIRVPSHCLRELTCGKFVIKHEDITLLDSIGEGEFGIVYKARLSFHGRRHREVAIKTLKGDFDQLDIDKFVEESLKMSRFKHSHVMGLIGVCLDAGSAPFIIMPYMANGSLLKYLKKERDTIIILGNEDDDEVKSMCKRLTVMCSQIASGMEYLAAEKYIHRDLAARNCMIDTHFLIKITDFGLAEDVFVRNYFRQGSAEEVVKLPVKWMAPESLSDGHFSEKSDVWSYGVTMWEVFSGGKAPYPGTDPLTLMKQLEEGERMPKPYNTACSDEMYAMMQNCWEKSPEDRPTFKELHLNLNQYIERIAGYLEMGFNPFATEEVLISEEGEDVKNKHF